MIETVILLVGVVLGWILAAVVRHRRAQRHRHEHLWVPRGVRQTTTYSAARPRNAGHDPESRTTTVLHNCFCSATKTTELEGHWTLEQVTG